LAQPIANVEGKVPQTQAGVRGGDLLVDRRGVAEAVERIVAGFAGRHTGGDVVLGPHLDMRTKFSIDFLP
jgi:hypothetical protein